MFFFLILKSTDLNSLIIERTYIGDGRLENVKMNK